MQFSNPWGLLALLGIPAVLLIHALRRQPRTFLTNTMFLIEAKLRDPGGGKKLRRLRRSAQLWLRLLLVLLLAWVLARPVTVREDSTQRIILVVDRSASMLASKEALAPALEAAVKPWIDQTAHVEWIALSSIADAPPLHRGWDDFDTLLERLEELRSLEGNHDPRQALDLALGLAAQHGRVIFVTDHLPEPAPAGIGVLAIGSKVANVGWCGVDSSPDGSWQAILRNYGDSEQARTLTEADGSTASVVLGPGEWRNLSGTLPAGLASATLTLSEDEFPIDDTLRLIRPRRKPLTWTGDAVPKAFVRLFQAGGVSKAASVADADVEVRLNDLAPESADHARLLLPTEPSADAPYVKIPAMATANEFTEGLIFDGLLWRECAPLNPAKESDTVLLWSGEKPVAILRDNGRTLELGFHPDRSNLDRVPSALVMVQRWLDRQRESKVAPESLQLATADRFQLAADPDGEQIRVVEPGGERDLAPVASLSLRAPTETGELSVTQGETTLLEAAVNFVDPIESDFRAADAGFIAPPDPTTLIREAALPDRFRDLWLLSASRSCCYRGASPKPTRANKPLTDDARRPLLALADTRADLARVAIPCAEIAPAAACDFSSAVGSGADAAVLAAEGQDARPVGARRSIGFDGGPDRAISVGCPADPERTETE